MSFTRRKVVYGSFEEHSTSEIRLKYTLPDQSHEVEWVHDTSLAALQISEALELVREEYAVNPTPPDISATQDLQGGMLTDCDNEGLWVVDPTQTTPATMRLMCWGPQPSPYSSSFAAADLCS